MMGDLEKVPKGKTAGNFKESTGKTSSLPLILIIMSVCFAVYFNALFNGFVYDDHPQILENLWIKNIRYLPEIFFSNTWAFEAKASSYYRPLVNGIFMLNYHLFGLTPWGFHLVNILFHTGVSALVFLIATLLFRESELTTSTPYLSTPFIAALLFVTHPIHVEAVTWVAGIADLSFTFFYLLSFYCYIRYREGYQTGYLFSIVSFFFATLCKEPALTLPVLLLAYDHIFKKGPWHLMNWKRYPLYFMIIGFYFLLRIYALGGMAPVKYHSELTLYQYVINIFLLFNRYIEKLLIPLNQNVFYILPPIASFFEIKGMVSLSVTGFFIVATYVAFKKSKIAFMSLLLILVPLLPALYIQGIGETIFAERYLYAPSFGFVLLLGLLFDWLKIILPKRNMVLVFSCFVLVAFYSTGTIIRNRVWESNYTLWTDALKKSPNSATVHNNLGMAYGERGLMDKALEQFEISLKLRPHDAKTYNNSGIAYGSLGLTDKAIERFQTAVNLQPDFAEAHNNLGIALGNKGRMGEAISQFQIAIKLNPYFADAYNNLGVAYFEKGEFDKAVPLFESAVILDSNHLKYQKDLARAYQAIGLTEKK